MLLRATTCYRLSLAVVVPRVAAKRLYETRFHRRSGTGTRTDTVDTPYRIHTAPLSCRFFSFPLHRAFFSAARAPVIHRCAFHLPFFIPRPIIFPSLAFPSLGVPTPTHRIRRVTERMLMRVSRGQALA